MSDPVIPEAIARNKRVLRGDKRVDNKLRRNSGQPYVSKAPTDGSTKAVCGKSGPVEATCKCVFACKSVTLEERTNIFKKFWSFRNYEAQQNFLLRMIERDNVGRRRHGKHDPAHPEQSRKQHTNRFFLLLPGNSKVQVCRKTFCSTFSIGEKRARLLAEKAGACDVVKEKRGGNRPRRDLTWKSKVIAFISEIPARESHYGREKSNKKFLSPDLNVRKLHSAFLNKHTLSPQKPPVSRQWFNLIFKKHFSLRFGPPRVDTCPKCDLYNVEIKKAKKLPDRRNFQCLLEIHHRKAEAAIQKMKNDRKLAPNSDYPLVLAFDLQKQFYLPALTHTQMYYSRQLACGNFGIHKEDSGEAFFYFWSSGEVEGRRGCNEIGTCVFDYVTSNLRTEKRNAIFWSDNCGGQNKNQGILAMYATLVAKGFLDDVEQKFPMTGHTFLSCDRDFGVIERSKKGLKPEVPRDLIKIIVHAKQTEPKFVVKEMKRFYDWMAIAKAHLDTGKLGISQITQLKISRETLKKGCVLVKNQYSGAAPYREVNIFKNGVTEETFATLNINEAVTVPKPWSAGKIRDIESMIPYVQPKNQAFLGNIVEEMKNKNLSA